MDNKFTHFKKVISLFCITTSVLIIFTACDWESPQSVSDPTFSISADIVDRGTEVTISTATENTTIWYTVGDGTQGNPIPDTDSSGVAGSSSAVITIDSNQTIKAIASTADNTDSGVVEKQYLLHAIFISDGNNHRIVQMDDMTGTNRVAFGSVGSGVNEFQGPNGIFSDSTGKIYIADGTNDRIVRIDDMVGNGWVSFGVTGTGVNEFDTPFAISLDSIGRIYIADTINNRIVRIDDMTGTNWISYTTTSPTSLSLDSTDRIYINDFMTDSIVRIDDMTGTNETIFGTSGGGVNQFITPRGVFIDNNDQIYISDSNNTRIVRIDDMTGGNWTTYGTGFGTGEGEFEDINHLCVDSLGKIYSAEDMNSRIVRIDDMAGTNWVSYDGGIITPLDWVIGVFAR